MNKLAIPSILTATVLIAGIFAFMPIDKASTVHSTILNSQSQSVVRAVDATIATADTFVLTCTAPYLLTGLDMVAGAGTYVGDSYGTTIGGDSITSAVAISLGNNDALDETNGSQAGVIADTVVITITLATDDGDEDFKVRASFASIGTCSWNAI